MTIKLIALDMDGTLLNRQKLVPEKNALAIKKAMDKGIYVTIATGRMPASASYFAKQLNMNCPVVSCNGGAPSPVILQAVPKLSCNAKIVSSNAVPASLK